MYRRPTKRQRAIRQAIIYTCMTIAVVALVAGAVLFIMGYRLDSTKGWLEQGALVQFGSKPSGATIAVDGQTLSGSLGNAHTPGKTSLAAGSHTFTYQKTGYDTWSKTLILGPGTLTWLDYARLVPSKLKTTDVKDYQQLAGMTVSPNQQYIVTQESGSLADFTLVNITSDKIRTTPISIPHTTYSAADDPTVTHTFTMTSWDASSRYILVKDTYGDTTEWLVLDTQNPNQSKNISTVLGVTGVTSMTFAGTSGTVFYGIDSGGTLRKYDINAGTISRALISHVASYRLYQNNIISYTGTDGNTPANSVAGVYRDGDDSAVVLKTVPAGQPAPLIAITNFYNNYYVAIAGGPTITILTGDFPSSPNDVKSLHQFAHYQTSFASTSDLSFSPAGEYLVAQSGLQYQSYDLEYSRQATATVATTTGAPRPLQWLDNAYLWSDDNDSLTIREFDGTNVHTISSVAPGFTATLTPNSKYFYSIGKKDTGYQLQRVQMILQ